VVEEKLLSAEELAALTKVQTPTVEETAPEVNTKPEPEAEQPTESAPKKKNRKPLIFTVAGVGLVAASIFGYRYWSFASTNEEKVGCNRRQVVNKLR
jgi:membrane fusion protein (multidrug efflux system)